MDALLIDAGVDWLTLTTKDRARQDDWREVFNHVAAVQKQAGYKVHEAQQRGYVGKGIGHLFLGFFEGIGLCRISSSWAKEYGYMFEPDAVHCTRIDLQTTWEIGYPPQVQPEKWYEKAVAQPPKNGRKPYYSKILNSDGGWSLYVGRRASAQMGRVYDKGVEQGMAPRGNIVRWELELKEGLASQAALAYFTASEPESLTIATLANFFAARFIPYPRQAGVSGIRLEYPKDLPDVEQTLKWLRGPVAKAVARSVSWVGVQRTLNAVLSETIEQNSDADDILESVALLSEAL